MGDIWKGRFRNFAGNANYYKKKIIIKKRKKRHAHSL